MRAGSKCKEDKHGACRHPRSRGPERIPAPHRAAGAPAERRSEAVTRFIATTDHTPARGTPEPLLHLKVPWSPRTIELFETAFEGTAVRLLRVRIREGRRFTVFDLDAASARSWGEAMCRWAAGQRASAEPPRPEDDR
jgi:hypothetical protein